MSNDQQNILTLEERLFQAAREGDTVQIRRLALQGANLDARNEDGWSALNIAAANGQHAAMRTLLAAREIGEEMRAGIYPARPVSQESERKVA